MMKVSARKKIIILGHTNAAEIFFAIISKDPLYEVSGFSVHQKYIDKDSLFGVKVVPFETLTNHFPPNEYEILNAVGYGNVNRNREKTYVAAKEAGYTLMSYIHPSASNLADHIGESVFVMPGAVIEPYATVGSNSVICSNTVIAHHSKVEEHCWVASGAVVSGGATIKRNSFIGVNATIVNNTVIEEYNIIGAQTLIAKNTAASGVYLSRTGEQHRFSSEVYAKHFLA
jgi:sugar O-acyltransferase (sialic acid O-acetyltransferase NeuD family)